MSRTIDYGNLMHNAMRGLIRKVLNDVKERGLPGEHHFFITFDTDHPDAELADWLSDRYPGEMTVVVQHWFDGLDVGENGFAITLNFGDAPEPLYIPYDAIKTFVDPSVEFGLKFEQQETTTASTTELVTVPKAKLEQVHEDELEVTPDPPKDAEIVSLDSFRK